MKRFIVSMLVVWGTSFALGAVPADDTLISHRGESIDAPENTLPAFKVAVERGFGFECDLYLSKDCRVFTFHDGNLSRTTGGANTKKCAHVSWRELSQLDVGSWGPWKGSKYVGTRPALLEEVLELARDGRMIYAEVKTGPEIIPHIKKVFDAQTKATPKNLLFISFNQATCRQLKKLMPEYKVYWLLSPGEGTAFINPKVIVAILEELGVDGIDCHFLPQVVTAEYIKAIKDAGFEFHTWTIDETDVAVEAFKRGVQSVTTNCAKKILDEFNTK